MEHPALTKKRWSLWGVRLERKMAVENLRLLIGMSVSVHWFGNGSHHFRPTSGDTSNRFQLFEAPSLDNSFSRSWANLGPKGRAHGLVDQLIIIVPLVFGASANPHIATIRQITSEKYLDKCVEWLSVTILFLLPISDGKDTRFQSPFGWWNPPMLCPAPGNCGIEALHGHGQSLQCQVPGAGNPSRSCATDGWPWWCH